MKLTNMKRRRRFRRLVRLTAIATAAITAAALATTTNDQPAQASSGINQRLGWDACGVGATDNASAFWSNTPYWTMGLYLGGSDYGSDCTRWTSSDVANLRSQGWQFMPLWVGLQAPCSDEPERFSRDPDTAFQQGRDEAIFAYSRIVALGWDTLDTPIIYDLEHFDTSDSGCVAAAMQFINGWVWQMHLPPAQRAGVYGSTCASALASYSAVANVPDFISGANWTGNKKTETMDCVGDGLWVFHQRHKQYRGDHPETWNGVTLKVDNDCSDGPVFPGPNQLDVGQGCV